MFAILKSLITVTFTLIGVVWGYYRGPDFIGYDTKILELNSELISPILFGLFGYLLGSMFSREIERKIRVFVKNFNFRDFLLGTVGFIVGLLIANLIIIIPIMILTSVNLDPKNNPVASAILPILKIFVPLIINFLFGYLMMNFFIYYKRDLISVVFQQSQSSGNSPIVMDTSALIDARILDVVSTGFIQGPFIIPSFVISELQLVADSDDHLKRKKGRQGLNVVKQLQEKLGRYVTILTEEFPEIPNVDDKLLEMSKKMRALLLTVDYNLAKVADISEVQTLNINDLANALKPVTLPGQKLEIDIIKEGKEKTQGIGYLQDGTMLVVENGNPYIGSRQKITITSMMQTSAGRLIFGRVETETETKTQT